MSLIRALGQQSSRSCLFLPIAKPFFVFVVSRLQLRGVERYAADNDHSYDNDNAGVWPINNGHDEDDRAHSWPSVRPYAVRSEATPFYSRGRPTNGPSRAQDQRKV